MRMELLERGQLAMPLCIIWFGGVESERNERTTKENWPSGLKADMLDGWLSPTTLVLSLLDDRHQPVRHKVTSFTDFFAFWSSGLAISTRPFFFFVFVLTPSPVAITNSTNSHTQHTHHKNDIPAGILLAVHQLDTNHHLDGVLIRIN